MKNDEENVKTKKRQSIKSALQLGLFLKASRSDDIWSNLAILSTLMNENNKWWIQL